jgi:hypothetical protein
VQPGPFLGCSSGAANRCDASLNLTTDADAITAGQADDSVLVFETGSNVQDKITVTKQSHCGWSYGLLTDSAGGDTSQCIAGGIANFEFRYWWRQVTGGPGTIAFKLRMVDATTGTRWTYIYEPYSNGFAPGAGDANVWRESVINDDTANVWIAEWATPVPALGSPATPGGPPNTFADWWDETATVACTANNPWAEILRRGEVVAFEFGIGSYNTNVEALLGEVSIRVGRMAPSVTLFDPSVEDTTEVSEECNFCPYICQSPYSHSFEAAEGTEDFIGTIVAVPTGGGSLNLPSPDGTQHAELTFGASPSFSGPYTVYGLSGESRPNVFEPFRHTMSVYIDLSDYTAVGTGSEVSVALSRGGPDNEVDYLGPCIVSHRRDFIFRWGRVAADPSTVRIEGSNNAQLSASLPFTFLSADAQEITETGWYTLQHTFQDVGGFLQTTFTVTDPTNQVVLNLQNGGATDLIEDVGGARYLWFVGSNAGTMAVDDVSIELLGPSTCDPDSYVPFCNTTGLEIPTIIIELD